MNKLTELEKMILLFSDYLEARGNRKTTIATQVGRIRTIAAKWGDLTKESFDTIYNRIWEQTFGSNDRKGYRQALRRWYEFFDWFNSSAMQEFAEWLRIEGYSEGTIQRYTYTLRQSAERINRSRDELKNFEKARRTFKRFMKFYFS